MLIVWFIRVCVSFRAASDYADFTERVSTGDISQADQEFLQSRVSVQPPPDHEVYTQVYCPSHRERKQINSKYYRSLPGAALTTTVAP